MRKTMFVGAVMVFAGLGCGANSEPVTRDQGELRDLAKVYAAYQNAMGKPPATLADLIEYQTKSGGVGLPAGLGRMQVPWGAPFGSLYREGVASETVFAYSSMYNGVVPVLMADGTVKTMSQADLDAAKKVPAPAPIRR
jgi:hypothetical protein